MEQQKNNEASTSFRTLDITILKTFFLLAH